MGKVVVEKAKIERLRSLIDEKVFEELGFYTEETKKLSARISKQEHKALKRLGYNNDEKMAIIVRNAINETLENNELIVKKDLEKINIEECTVYSVDVPIYIAKSIKAKCNKSNIYVSSFIRMLIQELVRKG